MESWEAPELEAVLWENPTYGILEGALETGLRQTGLHRKPEVTAPALYSTEIVNFAQGQRFHDLEASNAACVKGECVSVVPGSESVAGNLTVHIGTWENHAVPERSLRQAEEARRRYGGMVVGLTHSRGKVGVMPDEPGESRALEGVSGNAQRDEEASAIH